MISARTLDSNAACDSSQGFITVSAAHQHAVDDLRATQDAKQNGWNTFCEIIQLDPASAAAETCRTEESADPVDEKGNPVHGFCYLDGTTAPPTGNPELPGQWCPEHPPRAIHFTDVYATYAAPHSQSVTFVCAHEACAAP